MAYFERIGEHAFRATTQVQGAWDLETQHIAPALGLLVHAVETDRNSRRGDDLAVSRLSYDILGTIPIDVCDLEVTVLRPGRTIELVEATLTSGGRTGVRLRAWLLQRADTAAVAASPLPPIPGPETMTVWDATTVWAGEFISTVEVRRQQAEPGRAAFWARTSVPLLADEDISPLARFIGLIDIANGMAARADPQKVAFPNTDLTAHLFTAPRGEWVGFDTSVSFGPDGVGLTTTVLHDVHGPVGTSSQALTVRPG